MNYDLEAVRVKLKANTESPDQLRDFIAGFADRLNGHEDALGLTMALTLFSADVDRGINGFTSEPMPGRLGNLPPKSGRLMAPLLARKLGSFFPEPLASETQREFRDASQGFTTTRFHHKEPL